MKIAISYRRVTQPQAIDSVVERQVHKINALLKSYAPDLVQLHGTLETNPHGAEFSFSANLFLPTGMLHASAVAPDARTCARKALLDLETQIKKHQALLRKHFEWKRNRGSIRGGFVLG
jgi:ribosome-associated translation inhibitor RaiA